MFMESYASFFRKQKTGEKDHRRIDHGRFPIAIQDKVLHPDSVLGKLRRLRAVVMVSVPLWVLFTMGRTPATLNSFT